MFSLYLVPGGKRFRFGFGQDQQLLRGRGMILVESSSHTQERKLFLPAIVDRPDDEAERRTDSVNVFAHQSLHDRRLAGVVEPTGVCVRAHANRR